MRQIPYRFRLSCRCITLLVSAALMWAGDVKFTVSSPLFALSEAAQKQQTDARLAPTAVAWPGGRLTANEAVALLAASGNSTILIDPADRQTGARTADLPAFSGNYWQGVIAVCAAFELALEPGESMDQAEDYNRYGNQQTGNGTTVIASGGPVMLRGQTAGAIPPHSVPCGPILAEVVAFDVHLRQGAVTNRTADACIAFRLEPRVQPRQVGTTLASWTSIEDQFGHRLPWSNVASGPYVGVSAVALSKVPDRFTACIMAGQLFIQNLEPVILTATVKLGDKARTDLLGLEVSMRLIGEGETTANGQNGPGFSLSLPTAVLGTRPKVSVTMDGQPLKLSIQDTSWNGSRMDFFYRGPKKLDGDYVVTVTGQAALQQIAVPIRLPIALDRLPRTELPIPVGLDLQVATRVRWEAGECAVGEAITRLGAMNQVLLELGADERQRATLPACDGTFWEGVLIICRAFNLTILPPSQMVQSLDEEGQQIPTCITGGPLCLGKRQGDRSGIDAFQPSGILIMGLDAITVVTNQGLSGVNRQAELSYRLRLEPRLDPALIGSAKISWTSSTASADGRPLIVEERGTLDAADGQTSAPFRFIQVGRRVVRVPANRFEGGGDDGNDGDGVTASGHVIVSGLPSEKIPLHLSGQASVQLFRPVRAEVTLALGGRAVAKMAERSVFVKMFSAADDDDDDGDGDGGNQRPGISTENIGEDLDAMMLDVRDATGKQIPSNGHHEVGYDGRPRTLWYFTGLDQGPYTVALTAHEPLGTLRVPFSLNALTP